MRRKSLAALALVVIFAGGTVAVAQRLGHLRSWAGKYPTEKRGRVTRNFFQLPALRTPLFRALGRKDFNLVTRVYKVETPIKELGDYLAVKVCMPHDCDTNQAGVAINLRTGAVFVRMKEGDDVRRVGYDGSYDDLPQDVQDYLADFATT